MAVGVVTRVVGVSRGCLCQGTDLSCCRNVVFRELVNVSRPSHLCRRSNLVASGAMWPCLRSCEVWVGWGYIRFGFGLGWIVLCV